MNDGAGVDGAPMQADGGADADAAVATHFCEAGAHDFCIDFDDGKLTVPPWTAISRDGTLDVVDGLSVSSPKALHATIPERGSLGQTLRDRAFKSWVMPWRAVHVELDIYVVQPMWRDTDQDINLVEIGLTSDTVGAGAALYLVKSGVVVAPDKAGEPNVVGSAFPYGSWTHVTIDVDASHFRVDVGGEVLAATHATVTPGPNPQVVGIFGLSSYTDPICAFDARYDNIVVDFK
jgi:hypothetical protein